MNSRWLFRASKEKERQQTTANYAWEAAEKRSNAVILSPFAVILSAAKDLALPLRVKLREASRSECFQNLARFFLRDAQDRCCSSE